MDTIGMDSYPFIAAAVAAVIVVPEQDRVLLVGRRKANPPPERVLGPPWSGKRRLNRPLAPVLRTFVRCAIIAFIAHLLPAQITPLITPPETRP